MFDNNIRIVVIELKDLEYIHFQAKLHEVDYCSF